LRITALARKQNVRLACQFAKPLHGNISNSITHPQKPLQTNVPPPSEQGETHD